MHDPSTLAFSIKIPKPWALFRERKWRDYWHLFDVWHVDPEKNAYERGLRGDDSCGWFTPPSTPKQREAVCRIAREEHEFLFGKHARYVTLEGAIDFAWRMIDREINGRRGWVWKRKLPAGEIDIIRSLAYNPHDNLYSLLEQCGTAEGTQTFFMCVFRAQIRYRRHWWQHPQWHLHHWKINFIPWSNFRSWVFDRCQHCGRRFAYNEGRISHSWHPPKRRWWQSRASLFHAECSQTVTRAFVEAEAERRDREMEKVTVTATTKPVAVATLTVRRVEEVSLATIEPKGRA